MAQTGHYECDVCKQLKDPRGVNWALVAHNVCVKIGGGGVQREDKLSTVCYDCAKVISDAIGVAIYERRPKSDEPKR